VGILFSPLHGPAKLDPKLFRNTYSEKQVRTNLDVLDPFLYHLNDEEHRLFRHMIARTMVDFRYSEESPESALETEDPIFEDLRSLLLKAGCSEEWIANCAAQACRFLAMRQRVLENAFLRKAGPDVSNEPPPSRPN